MKVYDAASIRNVAVVGHGGSGKTQLVSALLFDAGMVNRLGKVDEGNTVTDYDEEEISRKHTLSASLAYAEWNKTKINLIDTPGFGNFFSDARAAIEVADGALIVVDAVSGVEVQTEKAWAAAEEQQLPRLIVVNRLDRERASLERTLDSVRLTLNRTIVPIQLPIGEERNFTGVVDLVSMKAYTYAGDGSGKVSEGAVPANLADAANTAREALIEMVAEADEALMEKFFEAGTLTQEELIKGLAAATRDAKIYPLVCTSGLSNIGAQALMDAILAYLPSPADRPFKAIANGDTVWQAGRREGAVRRLRVEDRGRSVRGPHHDVPRLPGMPEGGLDGGQRDARHAGPPGPSDRAAGQDTHERAGVQGRRHGRRGQTEGYEDQRHDCRQGRRRSRSRRSRSPSRCCRTPLSRRAAATKTRSARRCIASRKRIRRSSTTAIRRRTNCCSPARARCTSRSRSRS